MAEPSGQKKAGEILLLVGAILGAVGAFFLLLASIALLVVGETVIGEEEEQTMAPTIIGTVYLVLALVLAVGVVFGFLAHARARRGDVHGAWVFGLVSSLVPPLQVLPLVGAILLLTSPEHEAWKRGQSAA